MTPQRWKQVKEVLDAATELLTALSVHVESVVGDVSTATVCELSPDEVGEAVVSGIRRNKRLIVMPFMLKIIYFQHFFFPWIVQWLMNITGYRRMGNR